MPEIPDDIIKEIIENERKYLVRETKRILEAHKMTKLKAIRTAAGMSQKQLADSSGVNVRMVQHYEQGVKDINKAQVMIVYKLAQALGCSVEELIDIEKAL